MPIFLAMLWICFTAVVVHGQSSDLNTNNFFVRCDSNMDKQLTISELHECMTSYSDINELSFLLKTDHSKFVMLIDANSDNIIQLDEYIRFLRRQDNFDSSTEDDTITVQTRDGKVRQMTREEMRGKMSDAMEGVQRKGDKMFKEDSTTGRIEEIVKKNPEMGRFIQLGKWCHSMLTHMNYTTNSSRIVSLKTLPQGGISALSGSSGDGSVSDGTMMSFRSNFTAYLLLSVTEPAADTISHFELTVEYHPTLYRKPHLVIPDGWLLDEDKEVKEIQLSFPKPRYQNEPLSETVKIIMASLNKQYGQYTMLLYSVVAFLFLVVCAFGLLYLCCVASEPDITPTEEAHINAIMEASLPGKRKNDAFERMSGGGRVKKED